jgi:hypothetical protein
MADDNISNSNHNNYYHCDSEGETNEAVGEQLQHVSECDTHTIMLDSNTSISTSSNNSNKRRAFLVSAASSALGLGSSFVLPFTAANAAPPLTAAHADDYFAKAERLVRSKPPRVLRQKLNLEFAVLLMRASYNALDDLDVVAMDQFQKDFFLIRQAEYQWYNQEVGTQMGLAQQGMLDDPLYFDFISFAQYATIAREITLSPNMLFEEQQPVPDVNTNSSEADSDSSPPLAQRFQTVVVRRPPQYANNAMLAQQHDELVGTAILNKLDEWYGTTPSRLPELKRAKDMNNASNAQQQQIQSIKAGLQQLVNLFLVNGFAWSGKVDVLEAGSASTSTSATFIVTLNAPATLWSGKSLQLRHATPTNDFLRKTAQAYLARAGYQFSQKKTSDNYMVKYASNDEITTLTVPLL